MASTEVAVLTCQVFVSGAGSGGRFCFHCRNYSDRHPFRLVENYHPAGPFLMSEPTIVAQEMRTVK